MCWKQEIHTCLHAARLVYDAAEQEHHVCAFSYPLTATGAAATKCPDHSCCVVTRELVSDCETFKADGVCADVAAGQYEEVVFVPFTQGEEPVWEEEVAVKATATAKKNEKNKKVNAAGKAASLSTTALVSTEAVAPRGAAVVKKNGELGPEVLEVLFDADDEDSDSFFGSGDEGDDEAEDNKLEKEARIEEDIIQSQKRAENEDWEEENEEDFELPHMEFWTLDDDEVLLSPLASPSSPFSTSGSAGAAAAGSSKRRSTGKLIVYLEDSPAEDPDLEATAPEPETTAEQQEAAAAAKRAKKNRRLSTWWRRRSEYSEAEGEEEERRKEAHLAHHWPGHATVHW